MRLIDISDFPNLKFHDASDPTHIRYVILSHVWNKPEDEEGYVPEPTFQDLLDIFKRSKTLPDLPKFEKLHRFCGVAHDYGYGLVWADMCCIDKSSSSELSEAIASMFHWYSAADVCYVYLKDVLPVERSFLSPEINFLSSKWFKRCWTLQELIAPRSVVFFSQDWRPFGTKTSLASYIMSITDIPTRVLLRTQSFNSVSVAQKMSWAAEREATRIEDTAYCLMGLFGIRISIMYGEGTYAFVRLQEEILTHIRDPSLLVWGTSCDKLADLGLALLPSSRLTSPATTKDPRALSIQIAPPISPYPLQSLNIQPPTSPLFAHGYIFAQSPDHFAMGGRGGQLLVRVEEKPFTGPSPFHAVPWHMLHMRVPLVPLFRLRNTLMDCPSSPIAYLALVGCQTHANKILALLLSDVQLLSSDTGVCSIGVPTTSPSADIHKPAPVAVRIVRLNPAEIPTSTNITPIDVFGPLSAPRSFRDPLHSQALRNALAENQGSFKITLSGWCAPTLATNGYFLKVPSPHPSTGPYVYSLSLPENYETCQHAIEGIACPHVPTGEQCSRASSVLNIKIANCNFCQELHAKHGTYFLGGDVWLDVRPHTESFQPNPRRDSCKNHVASWDFSDGAALKTFTFPIRQIEDRLKKENISLVVTATLTEMPSGLTNKNKERDLVLDICACTTSPLATVASSSVRNVESFRVETPSHTPLRTSPISDISKPHAWPLVSTRPRSKTLSKLLVVGSSATPGSLRAPIIHRRRSHSVDFTSSASVAPRVPRTPVVDDTAPVPSTVRASASAPRARPTSSSSLALPGPSSAAHVSRRKSAQEQRILSIASPSVSPGLHAPKAPERDSAEGSQVLTAHEPAQAGNSAKRNVEEVEAEGPPAKRPRREATPPIEQKETRASRAAGKGATKHSNRAKRRATKGGK